MMLNSFLLAMPVWLKDKLFTGQIRDNGATRKQGWIYNVRILADNFYPDNQIEFHVGTRACSSLSGYQDGDT